MTRVLVIAHHDLPPGDIAAETIAVTTFEEVAAALRTAPFDAAVIVSDGFHEAGIELAAEAARSSGRPVIEVRRTGWDGRSPSPLSGACRGVIAGFGPNGVRAAVELLAAGQ